MMARVIGILAHVDAGKTTLAEAILYSLGKLRKLGRVDHKDAYLDTYELERARGITIFSKQAMVKLGGQEITLLDTPGHVDFSAEMERTLQVLDAAVLVISGADGVQGHVETLWRLLKRYEIPVFLFVNKMDQAGTDREKLLVELKERLDGRCVDFGEGQDQEQYLENVAVCQEVLMEAYLETGILEDAGIAQAIRDRDIFPVYFGSALKLTGVDGLLAGIERFALPAPVARDADEVGKDNPGKPKEFGARVFKISRDSQGNRLTHMKITSGSLKVKSLINGEKVDQIRLYSGTSYELAEEVGHGTICAVTGLKETRSGQGIGCEKEGMLPLLEPVLNYRIRLPEGCDVHKILGQLRQLEEEIPELHIVWKEAGGEIHVQVMGEVQIEILKSLIRDRFDMEVDFGTGSIVYKETIAEPIEGVGHFEPLRHYAEVHLLLQPGEAGSGLTFDSRCSEDVLDRNWQRLILTHLMERQHPGVLIGAEITDMRITLVNGRAHLKHTEGGDFRQSTYRAVRQGLRKASCVLLEPVYEFILEVPADMIGRAMTDVQRMHGSFAPPLTEGDMAVLKGKAPVATMGGYQTEMTSYTRGRGRLSCILKGYEPCHNTEEVILQSGYDPEADLENPTGSVFCAHGAGFVVNWNQVDDYAHLPMLDREQMMALNLSEGVIGDNMEKNGYVHGTDSNDSRQRAERSSRTDYVTDEELEEIFTRTYGAVKRDRNRFNRNKGQERLESTSVYKPKPKVRQEEYLLVDGYNIIFAWEELRELAKVNIDSARDKLMDILCNYQGYRKNTLILVFDAYKVKGNPGSIEKRNGIYVAYTKEAETADSY
ncbi:MAG: NYN domain-containing protein, partial [Lachnospiraceae bacterium]|nr:NYN domain-containing protein [Lachnospiraceae bacterium]